MAEDKRDMIAILKAIAESPKRDNSAYHQAIAEARQAFEEAEIALGGPVEVRTKTKMKRNGDYIVKWTFKRLTCKSCFRLRYFGLEVQWFSRNECQVAGLL